MKLRLKCYAKINLGLRVLGPRPDGYHELRTLFQTISLHDTLEVWKERGAPGVEMECDVAELAGPENLAARAAEAMRRELGWRARIHLRLRKNIPSGAGLGGGSSDAAAALRAVACLAGQRLPDARRLALAASLGADVPYFLLGGTALGLGRGTEVYALPELPRRPLVLVFPGFPVPTAEAYRGLDRRAGSRAGSLTGGTETDRIYSFCASVAERRGSRLENDFEPVVFSTFPEIARLKRQLTRAGASPALLSGSGSAVYGFFESRDQAARAGQEVETRFPGCRVWVAATVSRREFERHWPRATGR